MQVVIFAGGAGTRLSEETNRIPKPMVEIGGKPIIWHIMKIYASHGFTDFIVCCGYKGFIIKEYFANYFLHNSDVVVDLHNNDIIYQNTAEENWRITLVDTGLETYTANRLFKIKKYIPKNDCFLLTYGDGVADVDIRALVKFHKEHKKIATVTAVKPRSKFGAMIIDEDTKTVTKFSEKSVDESSYINAGFFVLNYKIFDYLESLCFKSPLSINFAETQVMFENGPLEVLAMEGELMSFHHDGFWACMDTIKDRDTLENLWARTAPWKIW